MNKLSNTTIVLQFILTLLLISLVILMLSKEYNKRQFHQCEISFNESMVTVPCEYVDGVVKMRI